MNTGFAFQIPDPAEQGTPDSTNLVIVASDLKQPGAKTAFEKKASDPEQKAQKRKLVDHWDAAAFLLCTARQNMKFGIASERHRLPCLCASRLAASPKESVWLPPESEGFSFRLALGGWSNP
jgi:hypothetical protein